MSEILYSAPISFPVYQIPSLFQANGDIVSGSEFAGKDKSEGVHNGGHCQSLQRESIMNLHLASHVIEGISECSSPSLYLTWGS